MQMVSCELQSGEAFSFEGSPVDDRRLARGRHYELTRYDLAAGFAK